MRTYFKYSLFRLRNKKDKKLRPIRVRGFIIQPLRISAFRSDRRFRYDAYSKPMIITDRYRIKDKCIWNNTTSFLYSDVIDDALERIYYEKRPLFLYRLQINNMIKQIEQCKKETLDLNKILNNYFSINKGIKNGTAL